LLSDKEAIFVKAITFQWGDNISQRAILAEVAGLNELECLVQIRLFDRVDGVCN
jgi:hypothetical protein